ncbi:hypothetical protein BK010_09510 [Tenericutes bacterium MO-XQ]|nr:hypothetical protein BK010_09510 [Tenericutes bacterium MO-XQ]
MKYIKMQLEKMYVRFVIYIILFVGLSFVGYYVDINIQNSNFSSTLSFSKEFTETLAVMAVGAIITIITITFSSILVVMTLYSGQFSPRTLSDFLQRKVPVNVLAFFIGISAYTLLSLMFINRDVVDVYPLTTLMMMIFFALGLSIFAYYIQYVSKAVRVNVYMDELVKDSVKKIEAYKKNIDENERITLLKDIDFEIKDTTEFHSPVSGYFVDLNYDKLLAYLKEENAYVSVSIPFNEHIFEDDIIFEYKGKKKSFDFDSEKLKEFFVIGNEPQNHEEYLNKTQKLIEIAVRALSPGVNDPVTAMNCIDQLGFILMKLSDGFDSLVYKDDEDEPRLKLRTISFEDLLYDHFSQIYLYGYKDLKVLASMIKALARISSDSDHMMKDAIWNFFLYIMKDTDFDKLHPYDKKLLNTEIKDLAHKANKLDAYKKWMKKDNE